MPLSATHFYLVLYGATLALHVVFMNYVLGGATYLAVRSLRRLTGAGNDAPDPIAETARDWLPFALGAAITAGVAPLLFVQILYPRAFYTANLLLFHRWMAVIPVLITGSYLLYLLKSRPAERAAGRSWALLSTGAFLCVAFTGLSWTENHLLSLDEPVWTGFYASGSLVYADARVWVRFAMWLFGSLPTFCLLMAWQLRRSAKHGSATRLAHWALGAALFSGVAGIAYGGTLDEKTRGAFSGVVGVAALSVAGAGWLMQVVGWIGVLRKKALRVGSLGLAAIGVLATIGGVTTVREVIRLRAIDVPSLQAEHAQAAGKGGLGVFVLFFIVNAALIAWCVRIVARRSARFDEDAGQAL